MCLRTGGPEGERYIGTYLEPGDSPGESSSGVGSVPGVILPSFSSGPYMAILPMI